MITKTSALVVLFSVLPLFSAPAAKAPAKDGKLTVAVAELEGRGLAEGEAFTLTDALRSYLINTNVFRVMERGKMDLVLKEQGFQASGACTDEACLVEMGQLLGVDHLVTGSIGKVGTTYSVNIRMINIATGEIVRTANKFYKGEIDGLLTKIIPDIAQDFASAEAAPGRKPAQQQSQVVTGQSVQSAPPAQQPAPAQQKTEVKDKEGGSNTVLWIGLGAVAVGGGVAAFFLLNKDDETPEPAAKAQTGGLELTW